MKVIGLHGILSQGRGSTDVILSDLKRLGHRTHDLNLDFFSSVTVRSRRKVNEMARHLADVVEPGDALVAHSAGCLISLIAMRDIDVRFGVVGWLSPAVASNFWLPNRGCDELHLFGNRKDLAIWAGGLLAFHPFGWAGCMGHRGVSDIRIRNHIYNRWHGLGHGVFSGPYREEVVTTLHEAIVREGTKSGTSYLP